MKFRRMITLLLAMILSFGAMAPASAVNASDAMDSTAATLLKAAAELRTGDTGGEWVVLGLARSGCDVPESYFAAYYRNLEDYVKSCGGVLHKRKYTEYSRVILALTAIGKDPTNVAGYDLTEPLNDFDRTVWQGINGASWALLALDSGNYDNDQRQAYIDHILSLEISGGGWALTGSAADVDITAMVLQALAKYQDQKAVKEATDRALVWLSDVQNSDGTFSTLGDATCESTAQVVVALCELGIEPEDSRFVKSGKSALDGLLHYYVGGGFEHISGCGKNDMATEQGFYAMVAADRAAKGVAEEDTDSDAALALLEKLLAEESCFSLKDLAVDGNDLLELGFAPGPQLGKTLQKLLDMVVDQQIPNEKSALLKAAAKLKEDTQ